jgi:glycerol-3-phosphate dehydrogenase
MKRNLQNLASQEFDVLIIGGGIYGATTAWEAALRGLKVALVEKGDFASGTSSNSLKIIHGGLRYLQHADFKRMRESIRERRIMMRIAPHLIHPLPCVMPTYGHFIKGPEVMRIALLMNDMVGFDRNWLDDPQKRLPAGRVISKNRLLEIVPHVDQKNLTGGAIWYDAQMYNSERLAISFLKSSASLGAELANYLEASRLLVQNDRVIGVRAHDQLTGDEFDVRAKITINSSGPWTNAVLSSMNGKYQHPPIEFSTALNLVVNRPLGKKYAFGVFSRQVFKDKDALISKGARLLFIVPWRNVTLIGTAHKPYTGISESYRVSEPEIDEFLAEANAAMPGADIRRDEVTFHCGGLLPMAGVNQQTGDVRLVKHFQLIDHQDRDRMEGLVTVLSVKYTTARGVAEETLNLVCRKLNCKSRKSTSARTRLWGGEIDRFDQFLSEQIKRKKNDFPAEVIRHLIFSYGSRFEEVLWLASQNPEMAEPLDASLPILKAECLYAVRHEMALKLADVVLRRTELGTTGLPGRESLQKSARIMAQELGWDSKKVAAEISEVENIYARFL